MATKDYFGNYLDHTRTIGRADVPNIQKHFSMDPYLEHEETLPEIVSVDTHYFWEFDKLKDQLQRWYDDGWVDSNTNLYVVVEGNRKYNVTSFEEFINYSIQDLVLVNKSGIAATPGLFSSKEILQLARKQARGDLENLGIVSKLTLSFTKINHCEYS